MNIRILSGVYDDSYRLTRYDDPQLCTSAGKRKVLYKALAEATATSPLILSPHPRGRKRPYPLPEQKALFSGLNQIFCNSFAIRKVRYVLDLFLYARHVRRHSDRESVFLVDNYELIYIVAIYYCYLTGRSNPVILEYEDGKHAIDRGWVKIVSSTAEWLGKRLVSGAILATPQLAARLEPGTPTIVVPGILESGRLPNPHPPPDQPIRFLYSGSLDHERGLPLLLDYLRYREIPQNTVFEITGQGKFKEDFLALMENHPEQVKFHGSVSDEVLAEIRSRSHFGLNLQSSANPISDVTYPSKTFDYLNAGIRVISTDAAGVKEVLEDAAIYLSEETPDGLENAILRACDSIRSSSPSRQGKTGHQYTFEGTVERIRWLLSNPKKVI